MRIILCSILFFLIICSSSAVGFQKNNDLAIEEFFPITVNGSNQWLLIRGKDLSKPVLLYLHGGPGQSLIPFAHVATSKLIDDFIVVYWDQRGAGLSFNENIPKDTMSINQMIKDTKVVTEYLKNKFHKGKIYLLGHSWGSTLGTFVVQKYPENYFAYIGVGQVVKPKEQERLGVEWLKNKLLKEGTTEEQKKIRIMEDNNFTNRALLRKYGGVVHNIPMETLSKIRRSSPYFPEKYTDALYDKGLKLAVNIHEEVKNIDFFKQAPELKIPVYFFLGRYDYITPTEPVVRYFKLLKAPDKRIIWFENSGHRMDIEESEKFQEEIIKIANK
jgi:pimeloyl-ACP methyl ester carboxylesterase